MGTMAPPSNRKQSTPMPNRIDRAELPAAPLDEARDLDRTQPVGDAEPSQRAVLGEDEPLRSGHPDPSGPVDHDGPRTLGPAPTGEVHRREGRRLGPCGALEQALRRAHPDRAVAIDLHRPRARVGGAEGKALQRPAIRIVAIHAAGALRQPQSAVGGGVDAANGDAGHCGGGSPAGCGPSRQPLERACPEHPSSRPHDGPDGARGQPLPGGVRPPQTAPGHSVEFFVGHPEQSLAVFEQNADVPI